MNWFGLDEDAELEACAAALRSRSRADALRVERLADDGLRAAGVNEHPLIATTLAASLGAGLAALSRGRAGPALRRGGRLALGAWRLGGLLA